MHEDQYTIVETVTAPGDAGSNYHLVDYQTQELVSTLWSKYLATARDGLEASTVNPAMRRVSYTLDSECMPGQELQRGIKALSRSRRACTFAAALWHAGDGRMIHVAELVTVFMDHTAGAAVEVPADFWAAVERMEGREIPRAERPG